MSKKSRLRPCPVLERTIEAFECAHARHRTFACPETCSFNPFSPDNYESYGKVEGGADTKFFNWLIENPPDRAKFDEMISRTLGGAPRSEYFHTLAWHAVYQKRPDGRTCLEEMARQGFPGLTGDEQLVLQGRMRMRPSVVEVHRIVDDRRLEGVDLLDPLKRQMTLVDRTLASAAVRFGVYALHTYPLPHFHRLFGTAYTIPAMEPLTGEEIVREILLHLGAGMEESTSRRWLMENYCRFEEAILAVGMARRKAMFANIDAQAGRAVYELSEPFEECKTRLREVSQIEHDALAPEEHGEGFVEARVWFANTDDPEYAMVGKGAALGRILLGKTHWRLEAMGASRLERFRTRFEALLEKRVRFAGERRDDLAARMSLQLPAYDQALVPPSLLRNPEIVAFSMSRVAAPAGSGSLEDLNAEYGLKRSREWLDHQVPALNGCTPRQAASDSALRPELLRMVKERIRDCDTRNLETGRADDMNWMVRELGLTEILFDPPPPRPRLRLIATSDEDVDEDSLPYYDLPDPEPLPERPFTQAQAFSRFKNAVASFPNLTGAFDYLYGMDYPLFDDLREITGDLLTDGEYQFLAPILSLLVVCFAPEGTWPPEIEFTALAEGLRGEMLGMQSGTAHSSDHVSLWLREARQPELFTLFTTLALKLADDAPKKLAPSQSARTLFIIILRVVSDELDRVMRRDVR